jgi:hypothetical protein
MKDLEKINGFLFVQKLILFYICTCNNYMFIIN